MALKQDRNDIYLLGYRRDEAQEDNRLNYQHDAIKHAILEGHLVHPSIPAVEITKAIADLGCGTGVWLDDVKNTLFPGNHTGPRLVGFDLNAEAFNETPAPGVQLIKQDCTKPFDDSYNGTFDLVNIRGLAYALSVEGFSLMIKNAIRLLRPGGYLQWLETETRLFKAYPATARISKALAAINSEREERDLAPYLPHVMLRELLSHDSRPNVAHESNDLVRIIHFNLLPGGLNRSDGSETSALNDRFSDIVLETVKLLLNASLVRAKSQDGHATKKIQPDNQSRLEEIRALMDYIDEVRQSGEVKMGGVFPQVIARKLDDALPM
ncbi:hypothetical protein F4825DRAFT_429006 [Nemania diffusa]|nr:hypothetical protein F4825DRAFT_429006 [Nemania diffusa]